MMFNRKVFETHQWIISKSVNKLKGSNESATLSPSVSFYCFQNFKFYNLPKQFWNTYQLSLLGTVERGEESIFAPHCEKMLRLYYEEVLIINENDKTSMILYFKSSNDSLFIQNFCNAGNIK